MGGEINEPANSKPQPAERPTSFDDIFSRPGKLNSGGSDAPGKLNAGGADSAQDKLDRHAAVGGVESAALSGDGAKVAQALKDAYEKMGGDANKFQKFGNELAEQLKKDGITVHPGKNGMAIHKDGSPDAVEYKMDGNLDPLSGKITAEVKAQTYDWATKQDINKSPESVTREMGKAADPNDKSGKVKDGDELGKSFDDAYNKGDFSQFNKDMAATFAQAYKMGGMEAVRKLEHKANDASTTPGGGPVAIEENGQLKMYNGEALSRDAKQMAPLMTPDQLKQAGIVKHPDYGYLHIKEEGPAPIELRAVSRSY